jgi:formylglycine-generating enzyme required for sulfatase activity
MAGIFISYRRDDSAAQARAVWERLCRELGRDQVFMDVDGIDPGDDFTEVIDRQLDGCQVMLVMVGARWHSVTDGHGRLRLHNRHDFVRYEVETALRRQIKLVQRMRWIKPGKFWMGSPSNEPQRSDNELRHRVVLTKGYRLADTACTQALWEEVVGANPSRFQGDLELPVECVSWNEINGLFLPTLNQFVGACFDLPTEAEWEYTCRAGTETPFAFSPGKIIGYSWINCENGETVPVKAFPPNAWGLYQMHGNVWEWCSDGLHDYPRLAAFDPAYPQDSAKRVLRGGGWVNNRASCRSSARKANRPSDQDESFGFRLLIREPAD